jgi:hypothetical protein
MLAFTHSDRRRRRRVIAALTAVWLVLCGVLGARHEAEVRHCIDRNGNSVHAPKIVGAHSGTDSDVRATDGEADTDLCAIAATMHQSASAACTRPRLPCPREHHGATTHVAVRGTIAVRRVYRLAPKTSPPTRA